MCCRHDLVKVRAGATVRVRVRVRVSEGDGERARRSFASLNGKLILTAVKPTDPHQRGKRPCPTAPLHPVARCVCVCVCVCVE